MVASELGGNSLISSLWRADSTAITVEPPSFSSVSLTTNWVSTPTPRPIKSRMVVEEPEVSV